MAINGLLTSLSVNICQEPASEFPLPQLPGRAERLQQTSTTTIKTTFFKVEFCPIYILKKVLKYQSVAKIEQGFSETNHY